MVIAHRGASGHALENTLPAFRIAAEMGCHGIELDVHVTSDGQFVVHHDPALRSGAVIARAPLSEVLGWKLGDGSPVPALSDVLKAIPGQIEVFIEVKSQTASSDTALVELIAADPLPDRLHVHSFDHRIIARLRRAAPSLSLGILSVSMPIDPVRPVIDAGATTLWQEHHLIDHELLERCGAHGIGVIAWTVNDRQRANALAEMGVAGLCGNWPERINKKAP